MQALGSDLRRGLLGRHRRAVRAWSSRENNQLAEQSGRYWPDQKPTRRLKAFCHSNKTLRVFDSYANKKAMRHGA